METKLQDLPSEIEDEIGAEKARWKFCGRIPLKEIKEGKRACRIHWRRSTLAPESKEQVRCDMLSIVSCESQDGPILVLERESAEFIEECSEPMNYIDDLLAEDWYLEIE